MWLDEQDLRALIGHAPPLLERITDLDIQLQPGGIDLCVAGVRRIVGAGTLGGPGRSRIPDEVPVEPANGSYALGPGFYLFIVAEIVHLPLDVAALVFPRSTLVRCGASMTTGVWDPGFSGEGRLGVTVSNPDGIRVEVGTTFAQMVFFRLPRSTRGFAHNAHHRPSGARPERELSVLGDGDASVAELADLLAANGHPVPVKPAGGGHKGTADAIGVVITSLLAPPAAAATLVAALRVWLARPRRASIVVTDQADDGPATVVTYSLEGVRPEDVAAVIAKVANDRPRDGAS